MKSKAKSATQTNLSGGWRLLKNSLMDYRLNFKTLGAAVLVAVVINWLIRLGSSAESVAVYQGLWFVFVSCALIWTIRHAGPKQALSLRQIYWAGSGPALKVLIVMGLLALTTVPFSIGAFIFSAIGWLNTTGSAAGQIITGAVWLALGLSSLLFLARLLPALVIATLPDIGPGQAIGLSWRITRGSTWQISARLVAILIYTALIFGLATLIAGFADLESGLGIVVVETMIFAFVLPVFYLWLFKLYRELA